MATAGVRRLRSLLELHKCGCRRFCFSPTRRFSSSSSTSHLVEKIGFIGLGNMGSRMADNLIKAGYDVAVHDINHDVMKRFSNKGIPTKGSPVEIAEASDVVITMLPSSHHFTWICKRWITVRLLRGWVWGELDISNNLTLAPTAKALCVGSLS